MANFVPVNPEIIKWARKQHGLSVADLADKLDIHENQIDKWESGKGKTTFAQARELANKVHIPFVYLFLSEPPDLEMPLPDLRTKRDKPLKELSATFREHLYSVLDKHDWYREYLLEYDPKKIPFVGSFNTHNDPMKVAESIRSTLSINQELRDTAKSWSAYLELLSMKAESAGILVLRSSIAGSDTRRKLSADEFQGFVLTDDIAPLVFINGSDFVAARIFTFAHELAHIWIGKSGILNPNESEVSTSTNTESFCNTVATETLVPQSEFLPAWQKFRSPGALAELFRVSERVIVRRSFELNQITRDQFFNFLDELNRREQPRRGGRQEPIVTIANRNSPLLMDALIRDTRRGGTLVRDGARLLNMRLPTFMGLIQAGEF